MNGGIWSGARRVLPVEGQVEVLDCDGSVFTRYENGQPREDISDNKGLLIRNAADIWRLTLDGEATQMVALPEPIAQTRLIGSSTLSVQLLLARAGSGMVYAAGLQPDHPVQSLGSFDSLPRDDAVMLGKAFWLGDHYFTLGVQPDRDELVVIDQGAGERFGDFAKVDGRVFQGADVIIRPGDLPLRQINDATLLVGAACYNFGGYVTDVPDTAAEASQILQLCQIMRRPRDILYDGLRIEFLAQLVDRGPWADDSQRTSFEIGAIFIENVSENVQNLSPEFLEGFDLKIIGTSIAPPSDAWPKQGVRIRPGQRHSWALKVNSNDDPEYWGWTLSMRHNDERTPVFGTETFYIGQGQFLK